MKTLIKNALCVFRDTIEQLDVLIDGTRIAEIGPQSANVDEVVDAEGCHLLPGIIDDQVHFRDPGLTHKEDLHTGSQACAKGGVTTYLEMPNTIPNVTTQTRLDEKLALAAGKSCVNYGFYIGATTENVADLAHATRTPGIKIFIGSSTGDLLVDDQESLERIFEQTSLPICAHCEDESTVRANAAALDGGHEYADHSRIRDHRAALVATQRAADLAIRHNHCFHVLHLSTAGELDVIRDHHGLLTAEVCPHHLFFNIDDYPRLGSLVQMNPAVKTKADNDALWQALRDGVVQVIATDHAPHTLEEKDKPYPKSPSGIPAVENSLALMLNAVNEGKCTLNQVVRWMCEAPARVWNIVGKGRLEVGYDADLVLVDLDRVACVRNDEQLTKSRWSPWDGVELTGWPVRTWVMGNTVFADGAVNTNNRGSEVKFDHDRGGYWNASS